MDDLEWENLGSASQGFSTYRLKVPGGWMVAIEGWSTKGWGLSFYPDPDYRWLPNSSMDSSQELPGFELPGSDVVGRDGMIEPGTGSF